MSKKSFTRRDFLKVDCLERPNAICSRAETIFV